MGFSFTIKTNGGNLHARTGPGTNFGIQGKMKNGTQCHGDSVSNDSSGTPWYHMDEGPYSGCWCSSKWCTNKKDDSSSATSTTTGGGSLPELNSSNPNNKANADAILQRISFMVNNREIGSKDLSVNASTRLFGLPHQLLDYNDMRISSQSKLGRMFTETFVLDAPLIYLKPGKTNYLPGMSSEEKVAYTSSFMSLVQDNDTKSGIAQQLTDMMGDKDNIRYFDFTQSFVTYITQVNLLCRIGAVFLAIDDLKVPWANGNTTYGTYDWRYYTFKNIYDSISFNQSEKMKKAGNLAAFLDDPIKSIDSLLEDDRYIQFYVDASVSFSEDSSNSTSQSVINGTMSQLSEIGKELQFVSGVSGLNISGTVNDITGGVDNVVNDVVTGDGAISTFLRRLTGVSSQLLAGSNFLAPEVWNDSSYGKNYSFTVTLASPYGTKEAWYLNIFVPLMHILAMSLPVQTSANTYSAPFIVQAFSPGWFSCDMGIIDSIGLTKGDDGAWTTSGLPSEIKVSISVKDLYANLALPDGYSIKKFFNNNGLLNFLMVNCGVDITKTGLSDKLAVFANLFNNTLKDITKETTYGVWYNIQEGLRKTISLYTG